MKPHRTQPAASAFILQRCLTPFMLCLLCVVTNPARACQILLQDLEFGSYDPSSSQATHTQSTWSIYCANPTSLTLEIEPTFGQTNNTNRQLQHNTRIDERLNYQITQDANNQHTWGTDIQAQAMHVTVTNTLRIPVYAVIPAKQDAWIGSYSDTITVLVLP